MPAHRNSSKGQGTRSHLYAWPTNELKRKSQVTLGEEATDSNSFTDRVIQKNPLCVLNGCNKCGEISSKK